MAADYSGIFGGGTSGSGAYSGIFGTPGAVASASKPKEKKRSGLLGLAQNFGSDLWDLTGIPAGLYETGKSIVHDAGKIAGVTDGEFQTDNIGGAIARGYYDTYVKPFKTNDGLSAWKQLGRNIYDHPLGPVLDAASVFTGGATLAGKIASRTAVATGSTRAMRVAGLQRVDNITPSTVRGKSGPAGNFAAATRAIKDPLTGNVLYEAPVHANPLIRARKAATESALAKLPASNYMSATRRGARLGEAETRRIARRDAANIDRAYLNAFTKLDANEKDALVYIAQGFNTPERATALMAQRADRAAAKIAEHQGAVAGKGAASKRAREAADVTDLVRDGKVLERVMPLIESPSPALARAIEAQRAVNDATQETFIRNLVREGMSPEAARLKITQRAQLPLRSIGIEPGDEVPMILTHVEDAAKRDKRGQNLERGMATRTLDEERVTTGENFLNARYDRDASTILQTHRLMFAKEQTALRMERALAKAEPFDKTKHANGIASGKLRWIKKDDPLVSDMQHVDSSLDRFESDLGDFTDAETETLREAYGAMHDLIMREGSPGVVLPTAHYNELIGQFSGARSILDKITDGVGKLTKPWRHIVLSLKGSFYVNNFIGNLFLGLAAYGPRYILDVGQESLPAALRGDISKRITSDVADLERTAGARNIADASKNARWDLISRLGDKVSSKGARLTEDNFRRAAFRSNLRTKVDEFKRTQPGMTRHEAVEAVLNDKSAVDQLAEATYGDLLDYSKLTPLEREVLVAAMPFWNFVRSMTGRTIRLALDEPWKMRVLLYFGNVGIEANADKLPDGLDLPHYLTGMIMADKSGETQRVMSSYGMNPFMAPVDLAAQLMSLATDEGGSQNPLAAFSPFFKVPLEAVMNKDFFTGRQIENADGSIPDGVIARMKAQGRKNIPQLGMYDRYRYPSARPAIERDARDTMLQYLGLPVGNFNADNVAQTNAIVAAIEARDRAYQESRQKAIEDRARF
jgi:hypothetical protein